MTPETKRLLQYFEFKHLPPFLQKVSEPFWFMANDLATSLSGPELEVGLRKLLESKDCCVRAALALKVD